MSNYRFPLTPLCILLLSTVSFFGTDAFAQSDDDRPTLKHQACPLSESESQSSESQPLVPKKQVVLTDGLALPTTGHAWALDQRGESQEFVHLKFSSTRINNHRGENITKSVAAPFVFRQKATVEILGAAAKVRLHTTTPVFYLRSIYSVDDMNTDDDQYAEPRLNLVKLQVEGDRRIANTINFGRVTLKAQRSESIVEARIERLGSTGWFKLTSDHPLAPGEYGLVPLPKTQNAFSTVILDFAVDPNAPPNADVVPSR